MKRNQDIPSLLGLATAENEISTRNNIVSRVNWKTALQKIQKDKRKLYEGNI